METSIAINTQGVERELGDAIAARERFAGAVVVRNRAEADEAVAQLTAIKAMQKTVEGERVRITKPLNDALRAANDFFRPFGERLAGCERRIKTALLDYQAAEERRHQEEQARLNEAARKERERLEAQAARLEAKGKEEQAETKRAVAAAVVAPVVEQAPLPQKGVSTTTRWLFTITDAAAIPREYLLIDEKKIGKVVAALKADTQIAGVKVYPERSMSARSAP